MGKFKVQGSKFEATKARRHTGRRDQGGSGVEARRAFTLVEMLVVIAIIALLLAALLPAFSSVRTQAKITDTSAKFRALDTGLRTFQAESAIGGALPPSSSDGPNRQMIANPKNPPETPATVRVAGAHLLVHAMIGADGLGTPGFRDVSRETPRLGLWSDDTHKRTNPDGIYAIGDDGKEKFPRYGGAGYVDEKLKSEAKSIQELVNTGKVLLLPTEDNPAINERMFLDPWDHPILYYRANPSLIRMTAGEDKPGVYWQEDNSLLTGSLGGAVSPERGLDFGQGMSPARQGAPPTNHAIADAAGEAPNGQPDQVAEILARDALVGTFFRFIIDPSVKARPTPVNKDSYLLISAGADSRYGTGDDVVNWTKKTD